MQILRYCVLAAVLLTAVCTDVRFRRIPNWLTVSAAAVGLVLSVFGLGIGTSLKGLLMRNIGFYIVAGFLVGTQSPVSWEGILYSVGNDYIVIYQPDVDRYITGDLYSLKFVEFHNTQSSTPWAGYRRREGSRIW